MTPSPSRTEPPERLAATRVGGWPAAQSSSRRSRRRSRSATSPSSRRTSSAMARRPGRGSSTTRRTACNGRSSTSRGSPTCGARSPGCATSSTRGASRSSTSPATWSSPPTSSASASATRPRRRPRACATWLGPPASRERRHDRPARTDPRAAPARHVRLLDADPDLGAHCCPRSAAAPARQELIAPLRRLRVGPGPPIRSENACRRERRPADRRRGALLRRDDRGAPERRAVRPRRRGATVGHAGARESLLAVHASWSVRSPLAVANLDGRFFGFCRPSGSCWPRRGAADRADAPGHHAGHLADDRSRAPARRAAMAPRRALGPRLGRGSGRAAGAQPQPARPARGGTPADGVDRARRARRTAATSPAAPTGRGCCAGSRRAGRR